MQAITTKYLGPNNTRGSRIKATTSSSLSKTLSYDDSLSLLANHQAALIALCDRLRWTGKWIPGDTDRGLVWVAYDDIMGSVAIPELS